MKCSRCQHENPPGARFCNRCGAPMEQACAQCGTVNPSGSRFCNGCGAKLDESAPAASQPRFVSPHAYTPKHLAEKILTSKTSLEGERKQVTVLFADLKGSMELLADRDPEEARKILDPVLECMMEAVHRYEGTVNQVMGDGIMALFGAPLAHEDHAVRACYAALRMQELVQRYAQDARRAQGVNVQIRVGLNSGEVVVRAIGSDLNMDYTAVGQTTHLAARMEQFASPGSILMTASTLEFVEGFVEVKALGPVPVKGLAGAVEVYEVTGTGAARTRLQASARRGLTRFVGRDAELEQLRRAQQLAGEGHGQVAAIVGEAGVGKSRLVYELTHSHRVQGWLTLESASVSYGKATSWLPVIELLKGYFKIHDRDELREIREKVMGKLLALDEALKPTLPALLALLDVPVAPSAGSEQAPSTGTCFDKLRTNGNSNEQPALHPFALSGGRSPEVEGASGDRTHAISGQVTWQTLDPGQKRQRTLDAVKCLLLREARERPLLLIFEDLHWIDGETQALLDSVVESLGSARLLLLVNYRPEYQHAWGSRTYYSQLRLDALPAESTGELLRALLGEDAGLEPLKQMLLKRGNPFFLEETIRTLVETRALSGERGRYWLTQPIQSIQVPATVQVMLAARIDRLVAEDKRLLQVASVIGKDVPFVLLQAIADLSDDALRQGLDRLQAAEFLYETGLYPDIEYAFKHALTHDVTYSGLLQERRRELHARIVEAIETLYRDRPSEQIERLAHHSQRGGLGEKAAGYLRQAGLRASARSALVDARSRMEQALDILDALPDSTSTLEQRFEIRVELRQVLIQLGDIRGSLERLREAEGIAEQLADDRRRGRVWAFMTSVLIDLRELDDALVTGGRALEISGRLADLRLRILTTSFLQEAYYNRGEYERVVESATVNITVLPTEWVYENFGIALPPSVFDRCWLAISLAQLGRFPEAAKCEDEAIRLAERMQHAYTVGWALLTASTDHLLKGDWAKALSLNERCIAVFRTANIAYLFPLAVAFSAWILAQLGEANEALSRLQEAEGLIERQRARDVSYLGWIYHVLGRTCLALDRLDHARYLGDRAVEFTQSQPGFAAHALHLLGDVAIHPDNFDAEGGAGYYQQSLALAEPRGMRPLIAHCHLGLGKLYQRTGEDKQAREYFSTAMTMYREMDMRYWLEQANRS